MKEPEQEQSQYLSEKFSALSDDELFNIINVDSHQYRPEALAIAKAELSKRGYHVSKKGKVKDRKKGAAKPSKASGQTNKIAGPLKCRRCSAELDYVGTRRLHEEKSSAVLAELGEMFKHGAPEMLDVYICRKCGSVEMYVDGIGEGLRPH
jgi:hypothetical protein